jgi:branched-chain amino acid transport system permease protein
MKSGAAMNNAQGPAETVTVPAPGINKWVKPAAVVALVVLLAILPVFFSNPFLLHSVILTFIYIVAAVSLRTIIISGQFPLAHGAFMGIGAFVAAICSHHLSWPAYITIPLGAIAAGVIGVLFAYAFAHLRSIYYAMGSLFFGVAVVYIFQAGRSITGGYTGLVVAPMFHTTSKLPYYYFFLALCLLLVIALYRFEFSRIGTILKSISQSHTLASSVGINERAYRVLAVGAGCFVVGLIGACFAHYNGMATSTSFNLGATFWLTMYVLIGGFGSFAGPLIGTPILYFVPQYYFSNMRQYSPYVSAVILIVIAYVMPQGIMGLLILIKNRYLDRLIGKKKAKVTFDAA